MRKAVAQRFITGQSWTRYWNTRYPSALTLTTLSDTSIKLDWTNNGTADFDDIRIERAIGNGAYSELQTVAKDAATYTDTVTYGNYYSYRIRYRKGVTYSAYCDVAGLGTKQLLVNDTFTDADGTALTSHIMNTGEGWVTAANWRITGNRLQYNSTLSGLALMNSRLSDFDLSLDISIPNASNYGIGLLFRATDLTHFWRVYIARAAGGTPTIKLLEANPDGIERATANLTHEVATKALRVVANDTTITVYWGGTEMYSYTSATTLKTATMCGVITYRNVSYVDVPTDNFKVLSVENLPAYESVYDGVFEDSIAYATGFRNAYSKFKFTYSGTSIWVKANPLYWMTKNDYANIEVYVNGVWNQTVNFTNSLYKEIILPAGNDKEVILIEGYLAYSGSVYYGTWIRDILANSTFVKGDEPDVTAKIVLCGDSIMHGSFGTNPWINGCAGKFYNAGSEVAMYSYSSGFLSQIASDAGKISAAVAHIQALFANVTTTKTLVIELGTNDAAASTVHTDFNAWYGNLLDAINTADSTIEIICLSPIYRNDAFETNFLVDYRTDIVALCGTRAYTTYINGHDLCSYPGDYADTIHPDNDGQLDIYNALDAVI